MNTKVSTNGLFLYLLEMSDRRYAKAPILEGKNTRKEALEYLDELIDKGIKWIE